MDWLARGLPYEGEADLVGRHLIEATTCGLDDDLAAVRSRLGGEDLCVVLGPDRLVAGTLEDERLRRAGPARSAMRVGVVTVRASEEVAELAHRMSHDGATSAVVTDPAGRLLGLFTPESRGVTTLGSE